MKILRIVGIVLVVLLLAGWAAGNHLLGREAVPETSDYVIDRADLLAAAARIPGERPVRVNHVKIAEVSMPRAALFSGTNFDPHTMVHGAYQVVYPDGSFLLIDSGFGTAVFDEMAARGPAVYDAEAFESLQEAMPRARAIVVTHEHLDHIQGLGEVDESAALAERIVMPIAQYENPETRELLPSELLDAVTPIEYSGAHAIAPGVVVYPAAGHTPGSQLVFVRLMDDTELLFIGDVAWHMDQIRELKYRPRLITDYFLGEDRRAVMAQFRTLHEMLHDPSPIIVSSHDLDQLGVLQVGGLLGNGIELPRMAR